MWTGRGAERANSPKSPAAPPAWARCSRRPLGGRARLALHPVCSPLIWSTSATGGDRRCPGPLPTGFEIHPRGATLWVFQRRETLWTSLNLTLQGRPPLLLISLSPLLFPVHSSKQSTHRKSQWYHMGVWVPPLPRPGD